MKKFFLPALFALAFLPACKKKAALHIGQAYQGGIIFYIDSTGNHGLIAAPADQSSGIQWSNGNDTVRTIAFGTALGTGQANTNAIVALLGPGNYAANTCHLLALNGYTDWFLPSYDELHLLYQQKNTVGGFSNEYYWSSTDLGGDPHAFYAENEDFTDGSNKFNNRMFKYTANRVRAIRAF